MQILVRLSLYYAMKKETESVRIMLLIFSPNYQERTSWGTVSSTSLGAEFTGCSWLQS